MKTRMTGIGVTNNHCLHGGVGELAGPVEKAKYWFQDVSSKL